MLQNKTEEHATAKDTRHSEIPATFCDDSRARLDFLVSFCNNGSYLYLVPGGIVINMLPSPKQNSSSEPGCAREYVSAFVSITLLSPSTILI